jgi:hypothetical protein
MLRFLKSVVFHHWPRSAADLTWRRNTRSVSRADLSPLAASQAQLRERESEREILQNKAKECLELLTFLEMHSAKAIRNRTGFRTLST